MILGFNDTATEDLWNGVSSARARKIPAELKQRVIVRLTALDVATSVEDVRVPPSNNLEQLQGQLAGLWSIRVNIQFRIIFRWDTGAAGPSEVRLDNHTY